MFGLVEWYFRKAGRGRGEQGPGGLTDGAVSVAATEVETKVEASVGHRGQAVAEPDLLRDDGALAYKVQGIN